MFSVFRSGGPLWIFADWILGLLPGVVAGVLAGLTVGSVYLKAGIGPAILVDIIVTVVGIFAAVIGGLWTCLDGKDYLGRFHWSIVVFLAFGVAAFFFWLFFH